MQSYNPTPASVKTALFQLISTFLLYQLFDLVHLADQPEGESHMSQGVNQRNPVFDFKKPPGKQAEILKDGIKNNNLHIVAELV
jgi:hypothetical protein